jgi:hypothetical protein
LTIFAPPGEMTTGTQGENELHTSQPFQFHHAAHAYVHVPVISFPQKVVFVFAAP